MFTKNDPSPRPGSFETLLGKSIEIKGTVKSKGSLRIEGAVEGSIETLGDVTVSEGAVLNASLKAQSATVAGIVNGNVTCSGRLELYPSARVKGDVIASMLAISEGAVFEGHAQVQEMSKVSAPDAKAKS
jgi:cytoskeletal protein CcmA (bactofilin family)